MESWGVAIARELDSRLGTFPPHAGSSNGCPSGAWAGAKLVLIAALGLAGLAADAGRLAAFDTPCIMGPPGAVCGPFSSGTPDRGAADSDNALASRAVPAPTLEYQVKAAFLLSFVTFTEWPATAFESPSSPVRICVMGDDPFDGSLVRTIEGEAVAGHPLAIHPVGRGEDVSQCHVLFVPRSADILSGPMIGRAAAESPLLIVGESDALWHNGAIIRFAVDQGRVRFDVNRTAAERSGLRLSSKLLRLARLVR